MRKDKITLCAIAAFVLYGLVGIFHSAYSATPALDRNVATETVSSGWTTRTSYDVGIKKWFVDTVPDLSVAPLTPLLKPYENLRSWVGLSCDGENKWPFIGFTETPIQEQINDSAESKVFYAQVAWGNISRNVPLAQKKRRPRFFVFSDASSIMEQMLNSKAMSIKIDWYGPQSARFEYSLEDIKSAFYELEKECVKIAPNTN